MYIPYFNLAKQQLLAAGDSNGTLHILEVPWALRQPVNQELACEPFHFVRGVYLVIFFFLFV